MTKESIQSINKTAVKSGSGYMLANIIIRSTALITAPIFTRILTTSDYGIASNFVAWLNIFLVFVGLGLPYSIGNANLDFPKKLDKYLASIQTLGSVLAIPILCLAIGFREQLAVLMKLEPFLVVLIFIHILFLPSLIYAQERYKFRLLYKQNIYISIFSALGAIVFCLIFILYVFDDQRYYGRIIGLIFPMFLMGVFFYIKIIRDGWVKNIKKYWSYALKISLPMIPHSLAMVVLTQIDRIMIIKYSGNSEAGIYSFGFSYAVLLMLFSNAVLQAFQPWLYISYKQNKDKSIKKVNNMITISMCILTLFIITFAPEAIKILGAKDFWGAKWVVAPIAIGALFQYVASAYSMIELYHKKTTYIAAVSIFTGVIYYLLNVTFIPIYGYIAAAFTTFVSYLIMALIHLYFYRKVSKKQIYNDKFIWLITILTAIIGLLMMSLYEYFYIRYFFLLLILLILWFYKREMISKRFKLLLLYIKNKDTAIFDKF